MRSIPDHIETVKPEDWVQEISNIHIRPVYVHFAKHLSCLRALFNCAPNN